MFKRREFVLSIAALVGGSVVVSTRLLAVKLGIYVNSATGKAINGYDPVAYFTENMPVEGKAQHTFVWKGATWLFASVGNKARFIASPEKYAPQYGGYCAFAVSYGSTATTVPEAWAIVDGKLYLNYSLGVRRRWNTDQKGYISKANKNWPDVLN